MNNNFARIASGVPEVRMGMPLENAGRIAEIMREADGKGVQLIVFPEMSLTGYAIGDLVQYRCLLDEAYEALGKMLEMTRDLETIGVVGMPLEVEGQLANVGAVIYGGRIIAVIPKTYIPNYAEFYEARWFSSCWNMKSDTVTLCGQQVPFGQGIIIKTSEFSFGVEICEDMWAPIPESSILALQGAEVIVNLSASDEVLNKNSFLQHLICHQSSALACGYAYSSAGFGETSTDVVFGGKATIAECGNILAITERFRDNSQMIYADLDLDRIRATRLRNTTFWASASQYEPVEIVECENNVREVELERVFMKSPYFSREKSITEQCQEMFDIQVTGLVRRLKNAHIESMVIGISGGLDSTLALLVAAEACDRMGISREKVHAVTMPGYGTSDRTHSNADKIMTMLGVTKHEIGIAEACDLHFEQIGHDKSQHDVTYENTQARQRTFILMNMANKFNGIVVGTGDLSELALGWATYNGDQMSMYAVNVGVPKTLVRKIVEYIANYLMGNEMRECLMDIVDTPISPELIPMEGGQITEDFVGPYPLHDFFIYYTLRYGYGRQKILAMAERAFEDEFDYETIAKWYDTFWRRFRRQQFKRSCMPDGPKVVCVALSPRGDLRLPSDL